MPRAVVRLTPGCTTHDPPMVRRAKEIEVIRTAFECLGYMLMAAFIAGGLGLIDFSVCIGAVGECKILQKVSK